MCGIAAIVSLSNSSLPSSWIEKMNERVTHRGPDSEGIFLDKNFALGHRRLSIVDTSAAANQPLHYKDLVITYNGEVYNFPEIRAELKKYGYQFRTTSDTEVVMAAYDYWGQDCVHHFEGMWAFVLFDKKANQLFISRDRFGQKPLIYTRTEQYFAWCSEAKQLLDLPGFKAEMNQQSAFDFLIFASINHNSETFFKNVFMLPAGHSMLYDLQTNRFTIYQWYHFPKLSVSGITLPEAANNFRNLFINSIEHRLRADVQVGSCLSGGLDSSSIVCTIRELSNGSRNPVTISICWPGKEIDEQEYIDTVVNKIQCGSHKVYPDMDELNQVLDKIIYHQDQPLLSASHFSEYKVYEAAAKENLKVMMDGQGADEYLAGYRLFQFYNILGLFHNNKLGDMRKEWAALCESFGFSNNKLLRSLLYVKYRRKAKNTGSTFRKSWVNNFDSQNPVMLPANLQPGISNFSKHQLFVSSLPYQLHSADRNSMCHSVEARLPFLDHRLVEFTYSLPDNFKIRTGISKFVLRNALKKVLPEKITNRQSKQAFPAPESEWLRSNKNWVNAQLKESTESLNGILNPEKITSAFNNFLNKESEDYTLLFRVINLNKWLRIFNASA